VGDLPPAWKSFYDRALDYLNDRDLDEAKWSAERALHYLQKSGDCADVVPVVTGLLEQIATLRSKPAPKSLWQHLRED